MILYTISQINDQINDLIEPVKRTFTMYNLV